MRVRNLFESVEKRYIKAINNNNNNTKSKCRKFTNITKTNSFLRQIQKQFQEIINTVNQYMFQNGFSLSVEKTVFVIFGPWHPVSPEFSIIINGQRLYAAAKQVKYLGVTFQWSGSVSKHVHSNIQSPLRATNLVKLLSRMPWANQPKTMTTLVKSLVRSRIYYGLKACYDMPASLITAIERAECQAIKLALGLPRATTQVLGLQGGRHATSKVIFTIYLF